jgi:hypothetical protein
MSTDRVISIFHFSSDRLFKTGTSAKLMKLFTLYPNSMIIHLTDQPLQEFQMSAMHRSFGISLDGCFMMTHALGYYSLDPLFLEEESAGVGRFIRNVDCKVVNTTVGSGKTHTSWGTLSLHCFFLLLTTVTKERTIPGRQLSWLWQALVYWYALTSL